MAKTHEVDWVAAVLEWCRISRPDMLQQVDELIGGSSRAADVQDRRDAFILLMGAGFDAGRCFQRANPECPLGPIVPGGNWKTITDAVHESRGEATPTQTPHVDSPCDCGHTRDQHDESGHHCDECDCSGFAPNCSSQGV